MGKRPFFSATRRDSAGTVPAYKSFLHRTRFLLLFLVFSFNLVLWTNCIVINVMVLVMETTEIDRFNRTFEEYLRIQDELHNDWRTEYFNYSDFQKSILFSSSSLGTVLMLYPAWCFIIKFGYRKVATFSGILSSFLIAFVPWFAYFGYIPLTVSHFLQGSCLAAPILLIPSVIRKWSTRKNEHFTFITLFSFVQFSPIFFLPVYSYLSQIFLGWPLVFYLQSIFTFLLTILFFYFYKETPLRHGNVSETELTKIQRCQSLRGKLSYEKILKCRQFQSVTLSLFIYFLVLQIFIQNISFFLILSVIEVSWMISTSMLAHVTVRFLTFRFFKNPDRRQCQLLSMTTFVSSGIVMISISIFDMPEFLRVIAFLTLSSCLAITPMFRTASIISGRYYLAVMVRTHIFTFFLAGCFTPITLILGRFIWVMLAGLMAVTNLYFVVMFRCEASDWEVRHEPKIEEVIAPVSHPRPCEFSTSFDDNIVVSIVSRGLDRCDTCKKHGFKSRHNLETIPTRRIFDTIIEEENITHM